MLNLEPIKDRLASCEAVLAAYLLGSAARGELRASSDIDIALLPQPGQKISGMQLFDLAGELNLISPRPVDLGVLSSSDLIYASQVLQTGRRFFCRDETAAEFRECTLIGMIQDYRIEMREIYEAYSAR
ncbi:type VII toxin-antitoxin system MntA family adenylyltransferase antitoxin [Sedimentisphaera salicampi]|uniref:Nucleotidyltransferase domain protein n=1 Tax=Sedimentisphaera salicampi TaxID=1941349 RepID=A0A1W6LKK6_9BACT|nr:nucleotidyltransferase domain-containing protein [Sedimentisphaera salicampi]ARN56307.1 Nucleotidyltransferase domain protein [Sedimentisphaera salicampi]